MKPRAVEVVVPVFPDARAYGRFRAAASDGIWWPKHYQRWLQATRSTIRLVEKSGRKVLQVEITDPRAFSRWCDETASDTTMTSLCRFASCTVAASKATRAG
jgi:hypothetical protein